MLGLILVLDAHSIVQFLVITIDRNDDDNISDLVMCNFMRNSSRMILCEFICFCESYSHFLTSMLG